MKRHGEAPPPLAGDDEAILTLLTRQGDCFASLAMTNTPPFFSLTPDFGVSTSLPLDVCIQRASSRVVASA